MSEPINDSNTQFWLDAASGSLLPHYVLAQIAELGSEARDEEEVAEFMDALNKLLRELKYHTSLDELLKTAETTHKAQPGCWGGRYALFDDHGDAYVLEMMEDGVVLHTGTKVLDTYEFEDGKLRMQDEQFVLELSFELPKPDDKTIKEVAARGGQPRCKGTVRLGANEPRTIEGKRGSYTSWGVRRDEDGDPAGMWTGVYTLRYRDDWEWQERELSFDGSHGEIAVTLGGTACTHVSYINNHLVCRVAGDADHKFGAVFEHDANGAKRFIAVERKDGVDRAMVGFLARPVPELVHRLTMLGAGADDPLLKKAITLSTEPKPADPKPAPVKLPDGTERMFYEIELELAGLEEKDNELVLLDDLEANPEPFMPIRQLVAVEKVSFDKEKKTGKWKLSSTQGETHSAAVYYFIIKHGAQSARLKLRIFSLASMVVSNTDMPPVVRGKRYVTTLAATGGNPPYVWRIKASDLPSGLFVYDAATLTKVVPKAVDPLEPSPEDGWCTVNGTPRIEGTVETVGLSQETFGVAVTVASKDVVMAPSAETLYFRVVEGEQIGGIGANWATFIIGGLSGLVVFLVWCGEKIWSAGHDTPVEDAAKTVSDFLKGNTTDPGSFGDKLTKLNDSIIKESKDRTNDLDTLKKQLKDLTEYHDDQVQRLGREILGLHDRLSRETNPDLRKQIDRDIIEAESKARGADKKTRDIDEAKRKERRDRDQTKRRRDATDKIAGKK
jgi:hypothetical protein